MVGPKGQEEDKNMQYAIIEGDIYILPAESEALSSTMYQLGLSQTLVFEGGLDGDEPETIVGVFYKGDL